MRVTLSLWLKFNSLELDSEVGRLVLYLEPFRKDYFPFGIQKLKIFQKSGFIITVIPPGGYYTIARKPNRMIIEKDWTYGYIISFGIYEKFNKNHKTCNPHLDLAEDECKLNQVE